MALGTAGLWASIDGAASGVVLFLAFTASLVEFRYLRPGWATPVGLDRAIRRLQIETWVVAALAWLVVLTGTYLAQPGRPAPPVVAGLAAAAGRYAQERGPLSAASGVGLDWKEHVAWLAPLLATSVALIVREYRQSLLYHPWVRRFTITLFVLTFAAVAIAGGLGGLFTRVGSTG